MVSGGDCTAHSVEDAILGPLRGRRHRLQMGRKGGYRRAGWGLVSAAAPGVPAAAALHMPEVRPSLPPHRDAVVIATKLSENLIYTTLIHVS